MRTAVWARQHGVCARTHAQHGSKLCMHHQGVCVCVLDDADCKPIALQVQQGLHGRPPHIKGRAAVWKWGSRRGSRDGRGPGERIRLVQCCSVGGWPHAAAPAPTDGANHTNLVCRKGGALAQHQSGGGGRTA